VFFYNFRAGFAWLRVAWPELLPTRLESNRQTLANALPRPARPCRAEPGRAWPGPARPWPNLPRKSFTSIFWDALGMPVIGNWSGPISSWRFFPTFVHDVDGHRAPRPRVE
jgi:hypothetical protein